MKIKRTLIAAPFLALGLSMGNFAAADDYGCTVLLCLSDPRGPMTESECVGPIKRLYRDLLKGRGFPSCALAGDRSSGSGSYAKLVSDPFDMCPEGLTRTTGDIAKGDRSQLDKWGRWNKRINYSSTHNAFGIQHSAACVGNLLGTFSVNKGSNKNENYITVYVYDEVVWLKKHKPRAIDVYIDGKHHQRVRY